MEVVFAFGLLLSFAIGAALSAWLQERRIKKLEQNHKVQLQNTVSQMEQVHEVRLRENIQSLQAQYQRAKPTIGQPVQSRAGAIVQPAEPTQPFIKIRQVAAPSERSISVKEKAEPTEPLVRAKDIAAISSLPTAPLNGQSLDRKIYAWGESGQLRYMPQLFRYANHPHENLRGLVAEALGKIAGASAIGAVMQQALPILVNLSRDRSLHVRQKAIEALGGIKSEKVIPILERALRDPSSNIVKTAGAALSKLKYYRTVTPTKPITKLPPPKTLKVPTGKPRYTWITAQPQLSDSPVRNSPVRDSPVQGLLTESLGDRVAAWGNSRQVKYIPQLVKYAQHQDEGVRKFVASALGEIAASNNKRAEIQGGVRALDKLSRDRSLEVCQYAVAALGKIQSEKVIPLLAKISHSPFGSLAKSASAALSKLKSYPVTNPEPPATSVKKPAPITATKSRKIKRAL